MPASTVRLPLAASFWSENSDVITAVLSIVLALLLATLLDRWFSRRGHKFAEAVTRGQVSPVLDTRLRFIRRLIYATILLIGIAVAASQFTGLSNLAKSILASGALAAAIIGFAARQTLANVVAGIMLAITQPVRVGDWITFDGQSGVVEDVRLNYTVVRTAADARLLIPNEKMASGIIRNDTLESATVGPDAALWLPQGTDAVRAVEILAEETGAPVSIAETTPEGIRLALGGDPVSPPDRAAFEADLRLRCLRRLQDEGVLAADRSSTSQGETAPGLH
jgi:small-conductance mechanosensitive channel